MMGFINTKYTATIDSLVEASRSKLNNPYYTFSDKKPTKVNYWKQNKTKSTVDSGSQLLYAHVSPQSAIRYNRIDGFYLYGIGNMPVEYDVGDNGTEASAISGEAIVLPNTIEPLPGDFFSIPYIKEDLLFKVNSVTPDTLDTGANIYKIEYQLELTGSIDSINKQVVDTYTFIIENTGTEFNCLIKSSEYSLIEQLDELKTNLCNFFIASFYNSRVQTYIFKDNNGYRFYDPCMIEFIRNHKLMDYDGIKTYVGHQLYVSHTFSIEYKKSIFNSIIEKNKDIFANSFCVSADLITEKNSLFYVRVEDYFKIRYGDTEPLKSRFNLFNSELLLHIQNNKKFVEDKSVYNILISYFNGEDGYINNSILDIIHDMDKLENKELFYLVPIYIYIINRYISDNILSI